MKFQLIARAVVKGAAGAALLAASSLPALALQDAAASIDTAAPGAPPLWRVTDEDSEIWLLGTFHILPPNLDWRSPALTEALDEADTYWFEAEVDTAQAKQKTLQVLMTQGFNKDGGKLTDILDAENAEKLKTIVADVGLPMAAVDPMRPWQAFLTLSVQFIVDQGYDPASGVETVLLRAARAKGKNVKFFETIEEQLGLFTSLPAATEKKLLVFTLEDWDQQAEEFNGLVSAWRVGDTEAIDEMMNAALRDRAPSVYDVLVTRRNAKWVDEIAVQMAGSGKILVAVGAGHLVGDKSVPALLQARGFTVERVTTDEEPAEPAAETTTGEDPLGELLEREMD